MNSNSQFNGYFNNAVCIITPSVPNCWTFQQNYTLGVRVDYNVVHLRTSLVQLFVPFLQNFGKIVQMIELKRFGGAPNGYPFAPLLYT
jgi:hypothetical protein